MLLTVPGMAAGAGFVEAVTGGVGWVDMSVSGKTGKKGNGPMQDHERLRSDGSGQWERCHTGAALAVTSERASGGGRSVTLSGRKVVGTGGYLCLEKR